MRTQGSARRSRATWSPRRVSSFSRASSWRRCAVQSSSETTGWSAVLAETVAVFIACSLAGRAVVVRGWSWAACSLGRREAPPSRRLARRVGSGGSGRLLAAASGRPLLRPAHGAHLAAASAAAIEQAGAIGLEPADAGAGGHLQALEHRAVGRVDVAQLALVAFPGAVPQLAVDPGHARDEAVGGDGAQDGAGGRVDLVDAAVAVLADPQAALGPGQARVAAAARRGDRAQHAAAGGVDLGDALLGDLPEVLAVERGAGVARLLDAADRRAAGRVEGQQRRAGGGPDVVAVVGDAGHVLHALERVLAHDLGGAAGDAGLAGGHGRILSAPPWRVGMDSTQTAGRRGVTR